jgi:hypothetical protein
MSSNFTIQRKRVHCKQTFNAKTTVTRFCGKLCNKRFNATKQRNEKTEAESLALSVSTVAQQLQFSDQLSLVNF